MLFAVEDLNVNPPASQKKRGGGGGFVTDWLTGEREMKKKKPTKIKHPVGKRTFDACNIIVQ